MERLRIEQRPAAEGEKPLADDLLWGVRGPDGIAAWLGIDEAKAYYLIRQKRLPIKKLGAGIITARKSELDAFLRAELEEAD